MNGNILNKNEQTDKYIAEIRNLYKEGNLFLVFRMLDVFNRIPDELHEIAIDTLIRTARISSSYLRAGLRFLTWKNNSLPLNPTERERVLSAFLDLAADPTRQDYQFGEIIGLAKIDDPRVYETLAMIYKNDDFRERKQEVVYGLGTMWKETALPILLDHIYRQINHLSVDEIHLLEKYPVSNSVELVPKVNMEDRDKVVEKFIKYLLDNHDYSNPLRTDMAHTLAILNASYLTSIKSKELIKENENVAICYGHDEYIHISVEYIYLREFVNISKNDSM